MDRFRVILANVNKSFYNKNSHRHGFRVILANVDKISYNETSYIGTDSG